MCKGGCVPLSVPLKVPGLKVCEGGERVVRMGYKWVQTAKCCVKGYKGVQRVVCRGCKGGLKIVLKIMLNVQLCKGIAKVTAKITAKGNLNV